MVVLVVISIISASVDSKKNENSIKGYYSDEGWPDFDYNLWTYTINADAVVTTKDTKLRASPAKPYVKGIDAADIKTIQYLPITVHEKFPNLEAYQFRNCSIKEISYENFQNLSEIQYLNLGFNEITTIPSSTFQDLSNLKTLELYNNLFQTINGQSLIGLQSLTYLSLQQNQITLLPDDAFDMLTGLEKISLAYNKLETLNDAHFKNNKKIDTIWLEMNIIKSLSLTMFDGMASLDFIDFENNTCINGSYYADTLDDMKEKIKIGCQLLLN